MESFELSEHEKKEFNLLQYFDLDVYKDMNELL